MKKHLFSEKKKKIPSHLLLVQAHTQTTKTEKESRDTKHMKSPNIPAQNHRQKASKEIPSKIVCLCFYKDTVLSLYSLECSQQHRPSPL